jgi:hypothetical protein
MLITAITLSTIIYLTRQYNKCTMFPIRLTSNDEHLMYLLLILLCALMEYHFKDFLSRKLIRIIHHNRLNIKIMYVKLIHCHRHIRFSCEIHIA